MYKSLTLAALLLSFFQYNAYASSDIDVAAYEVATTEEEHINKQKIKEDAYSLGYGIGFAIAQESANQAVYLAKALTPLVIGSGVVNLFLHSLGISFVKDAPATSLVIGCFAIAFCNQLKNNRVNNPCITE